MSLFDFIFKNRPKEPTGRYTSDFRMLNGYVPRFTTWNGGLYESELIRSAIHTRATHMSKLSVEIQGAARPQLVSRLKHAPNQFQTWGQFLYRASTILDLHNSCVICPMFDQYGDIYGLYTPLPSGCEIVEYNGVPYMKYIFHNRETAAVELSLCGIMTKHQYRSDFFGENNNALIPTQELIHIQNQGIQEGVKNSASYRFMARLSNFTKDSDLTKERQRFTEENFSSRARGGGMLLFPKTYEDIRQIDVKPWVVDADQMKVIRESVNQYFGVNEDVLENKAYGDSWNAFYEGAIEPFAIQFSDVTTKMLYTLREQSQGNRIFASSNRLQYLSNSDKLKVSSEMLDRGIMSINDVREIWNLPPVEGGDVRIIRGEYYNADEKVTVEEGTEDEG